MFVNEIAVASAGRSPASDGRRSDRPALVGVVEKIARATRRSVFVALLAIRRVNIVEYIIKPIAYAARIGGEFKDDKPCELPMTDYIVVGKRTTVPDGLEHVFVGRAVYR